MTRAINGIIIHCAATPNGKDFTVEDIDRWHDERGFARRGYWRMRFNQTLRAIGYHYVIYTSGEVVTGRHEDEVGAHAGGFNAKTIGICMIGTSQYSAAQWKALDNLVAGLQKEYPAAKVLGHRDLSPDLNGNGIIEPDEWTKTCPGFDVKKWLTEGVPEDSVLNEQ